MDCPGEYLKRERKLREVLLDDISREIKVPVKLLRALEADDYQSLPHTTFVKGFIRAYCKFLGVDENDALLRYELYLQEIAEFEEPVKKTESLDVEERSYPVRKYLRLVLVGAGIIIIAGVYYLSSGPGDDDVVVDKPVALKSEKKDAQPVKAALKVEDTVGKEAVKRKVAKTIVRRKESGSEKLVKIAAPEVPSASKSPAKAVVSEKTITEEKKEAPPFVSLPALKPEELTKMDLAPGTHLLRAHASALTWMKIEIDSGEPFEIMLQPGEKAEWKGKVFFCS